MNKLSTISVAVVLAGLAVASGANAQSRTRDQVLAELQQARASGEMAQRAAETEGVGALAAPVHAAKARSASEAVKSVSVPAAAPAKGKTRAEVVAELQRARETGELEEQFSEGGPGYFAVTRGISGTPVLAGK